MVVVVERGLGGGGGGGDRYRERKGVRETEKHEGSEGVNIDGFDPTHAVARLWAQKLHTHTLTQSGSITTGFIALLVPAYHLNACTQKTSDFKATVTAAHCQPCFHTEGDGPLKHVAQSPNPQLLATRRWWNSAVHHNQWDWAGCYMTQDQHSWGCLLGDQALGLQLCRCSSLLESGRWWDWTSRMPLTVVLVARLSHNPASLTFSTKGAC